MADKWKWWVAASGLMLVAGSVQADSLEVQRQHYEQIKQAWDDNQMDTVAQLMPGLQDYPLYPYLEYRQLTQDFSTQTASAVKNFIQHYPTLPLAHSLTTRFINELARREDWRGLLAFSPQEPGTVTARCNWYYAKWATGEQQVAWQGAKKLWLSGSSRPSSCDTLFSVWQEAGQQNPETTLERIRLAMKAGNSNLVNFLAKQLPDDYQTIATALMDQQNDPQTLSSFVSSVGATPFTRQATMMAFSRLARADAEQARQMIPMLVKAQKLDEQQTQALKESVAWQLMGNDITSSQARWRDDVIMRSESTSLIERRVRMALGDNDRRGLNTWIARLPVEDKAKDEWQYWQADLLLERGRKKEGEGLLRNLMKERGFYPMVAAQRLGVDYSLSMDKAPAIEPSLINSAEIARVKELMYWGMDNLARSEWRSLLSDHSVNQQHMLASYALQQNWWDLSVQATISGKLWNSLEERFPLAWQPQFNRYISGKSIPLSYAMAIARQESAWNPKVRSPVGATGLMQLMPATAQHTVQKFSLEGYSNSSQLLDADTNIKIGTQYLESVYQQFGLNRIFASAAYNAGPGRVHLWQDNSAGKLDVVAFIETIPFKETRGYVKNVLAYDAYYRHFLHQPGKLFTDNEWQQRY